MIQQISDAELEAMSEEYPDCTFVAADEQGLFEC